MIQLSTSLLDRVLTRHPLPVADSVAALGATDSLHERRDRVVEVFRTVIRTLGALCLAARVQFGAGPGGDSEEVRELLRALRQQGLTDGRWIGLCRELLRPFAETPDAHPLPELVRLFHGDGAWKRTLEGLLRMRKAETVAHGPTGREDDLKTLLGRRLPELERLLMAVDPLWERLRLVVPAPLEGQEGGAQRALLLMGDTPGRGRWRRVELGPGPRLAPGEPVLVDADGRPILALHPVALLHRPTPEVVEELFLLDGSHRGRALYVAFPSMAEHREEGTWQALTPLLLGEKDAEEGPGLPGIRRPYRGLESFGPEHAALFFGREQRAEALANRIRRRAMVTVTGPSGSGKSSLLKAGVLPQLEGWACVIVRPGHLPTQSLARRLGEVMGPILGETEAFAANLAAVPTGPEAVGPLLQRWSLAGAPPFVILVDQAEELFTLCADKTTREAFAALLAALAPDEDGPGRVVLSVREDFFSRFALLPTLRGRYTREVEVVTTPDREALLRTVVLPAQRFGYAFEDEDMVAAMVDAVEGEPAALTLLQFCADRLWEARDRTWRRLTLDAYRAMGGVEGALATHAEAVLGELTPGQQTTAAQILQRLVTTEGTRAVVPRAELVQAAAEPQDAELVLDRFVQARLLMVRESDAEEAGTTPADAVVELAHEALIRHWARLRRWLDEDREGRRLLESLRQAARAWDTRGRPAGLLWRGDALTDYHQWRRRSTQRLTPLEAAFIDAGEAGERRWQHLKRALASTAAVVLTAALLVMFLLWRSAERTEAEAIRQVSRLLASAAGREVREGDPAKGVLLAMEGLGATAAAGLAPLPEAEDALWEALAMVDGAVVRTRGAPVTRIDVAEGGLTATLHTAERALRLHLDDASTLVPLPGPPPSPPSPAAPAEAAPADVLLDTPSLTVTGRPDGSLTLTTGPRPRHLRSHEASPVTALAVDPAGRWLLTAWADGSVWRWGLPDTSRLADPCGVLARNLTATEWRQYFPTRAEAPTCPGIPEADDGEGHLTLAPTPAGPLTVWVDGVRRRDPVDGAPLSLPAGAHHLRLWRAGCLPVEVTPWVWAGVRHTAPLQLTCGPEAPRALSTDTPDWVKLPGGPLGFSARDPDRDHHKRLVLPPFEVTRTPVTAAQYTRCQAAGACRPTPAEAAGNPTCNGGAPGREDHPINCLSWHDARAYCAWLGARLLSEAEWEFAARGGAADRAWPWGEDPPTCAVTVMDDGRGPGCGTQQTWAVCSRGAGVSAEGLCDLNGNVYTWVEDCRHKGGDFTDVPADGSPWLTGCTSQEERVLRGGVFFDPDWKLELTNNHAQMRWDFSSEWVGVRCAR